MKKLLMFLTIFIGSIFSFLPVVHAQDVQFHEAEFIAGSYVVRQKGGVHYYQQGRFIKRNDTYEIAYCLQPFNDFSPEAVYKIEERLNSLDEETLRKLKLTVAFGYPFVTSDVDYYMATQIRIWEIMEPEYEYYFTDGLDGPRTDRYDHLFTLLDDSIQKYTHPSFENQTYKTTTHGNVRVDMPTDYLYEDIIESDIPYERDGESVIFKDLKEGKHTINVTRKFTQHNNTPLLFYYHDTSQLLMGSAPLDDIHFSFTIEAIDTSIHVTKIDQDTKSKVASGDASLKGASISLFDSKNKEIAQVTFDENLEATISVSRGNVSYLPFGTYTLKETKAGKGYLLNEKEIQVTIDEKHPNIDVNIVNQVIKNQITLQKYFGDKQLLKGEAGISFEIYDMQHNLVQTIVTNEQGIATFSLPYGTYTVHQKTTTEGYKEVEDFQIQVTKNGEKQHFELHDIKKEEETPHEPQVEIEVPNTSEQASIPFFYIITSLLGVIYVEKKIWI